MAAPSSNNGKMTDADVTPLALGPARRHLGVMAVTAAAAAAASRVYIAVGSRQPACDKLEKGRKKKKTAEACVAGLHFIKL